MIHIQALFCTEIQKDPNSKYPIYKITFPAEVTLQHIKKVSSLFLIRVYWEKFNSSKPFIQCFRCQAHGHTSINCSKDFECMKCAGSYDSTDCLKTLDTPATCVNCIGDHTANYSKCLALLNYLGKKSCQNSTPCQSHILLLTHELSFHHDSTQLIPLNHMPKLSLVTDLNPLLIRQPHPQQHLKNPLPNYATGS